MRRLSRCAIEPAESGVTRKPEVSHGIDRIVDTGAHFCDERSTTFSNERSTSLWKPAGTWEQMRYWTDCYEKLVKKTVNIYQREPG
jgi:hypothetical protein